MTDQSQVSAELDETDLNVINTLQLDPRASWARIGSALDLDPVTVARRWSRLSSSGVAWVAAHVGRLPESTWCTAFVEVDCDSDRALDVAATLARWPHVLTVEHASGGRDLLLTVMINGLTLLSRYLLECIGSIPGVRTTRSQLLTEAYTVGGYWRLRSLDPRQQARLSGDGHDSRTRAPHALTATDRNLAVQLCRDGRRSLTELAERAGVSLSTARRRLGALLANETLLLRCDMAQPLSGWPVSLWLWAEAPPDDQDHIARQLAMLPETRACFAITGGRGSLFFSMWLRSLGDAQELETQLTREVPGLRIVDRAVVLRFVKRVGHLVDDSGRSTGVVPTEVWSDPISSSGAGSQLQTPELPRR